MTPAADLADALERAERERKPLPGLSSCGIVLDLEKAYAVQDEVRARKERRGQRACGFKVAITSARRMKELGVDAPLCGWLAAQAGLGDGASLAPGELIAPRIEPEVAFVTKRDLEGAKLTLAEVLAATDHVVAALEILDSRFAKGPFDPLAAAADNVSTARHVTGTVRRAPEALDLSLVGCAISRNGELVGTGASAAVFGHPAGAVVALAAVLARRGQHIPAGSLVLTGGLVDAFAVAPGDAVTARLAGLGEISVGF